MSGDVGEQQGGDFMTRKSVVRSYLLSTVAPAILAAASMATTSPALAQCSGPGTKTSQGNTAQTQCATAITIPGNALRSFDISWVDSNGAFYFLADRSNAGIDVIDTNLVQFDRTITGGAPNGQCPTCKFQGVKCSVGGTVVPCTTSTPVNNNISGPDGVVSHGVWVYAGDGDSTLKVIDLTMPGSNAIVESVSTGGSTRVDEMALDTTGTLLLAANNAEDPPFATLMTANGDNLPPVMSNVNIIIQVKVDPAIIPSGAGLSLEQPTWEPATQRFYTSIPIIRNNPPGCNFGQFIGPPITCDGGVLVFDPAQLTGSAQCGAGSTPAVCVLGAFNPTTYTGVIALHSANKNAQFQSSTLPFLGPGGCGPNGATVGPNNNVMFGCTPGNNPFDSTTQVLNVARQGVIPPTSSAASFADVADITGSDEVWFNSGDGRYYLGASKSYTTTPVCTPNTTIGSQKVCAVLGVVDQSSVLVETIPQSSNSHSVAADSVRNLIFVPQVAPAGVVGSGGDTTSVGSQLCGGNSGCIVVYVSPGLPPPGSFVVGQ
jgi:hypothetical protein